MVFHYLDDSQELLDAFGMYLKEVYKVEIITYNDPLKFFNNLDVQEAKRNIVLVDFDLKCTDLNGIKIIRKLVDANYADISSIFLFTGLEEHDSLLSELSSLSSERVHYLKKTHDNLRILLEDILGQEPK